MQQFKVSGMSCGHCVRAVTQAIKALDPAAQVDVDLAAGVVQVDSDVPAAQLEAAIRGEGYEVSAP